VLKHTSTNLKQKDSTLKEKLLSTLTILENLTIGVFFLVLQEDGKIGFELKTIEQISRVYFLSRSFWRHVILPSIHKPEGDGVAWTTVLDGSHFQFNDHHL
jgi:hypothetical protein